MFTGLIRAVGRVAGVEAFGGGRRLGIDLSGLGEPLPARGASVAVSGACLTLTSRRDALGWFDAVAETLARTHLGGLAVGARVNLEPALRLGDPLDGHIVLGHVDALSTLLEVVRRPDSAAMRFSLPPPVASLVAEKGSVALDGISLTVVDARAADFTVSVIPATWRATTLADLVPGDRVNLEVDVLARYAARRMEAAGGAPAAVGGLTMDKLRAAGFA